jgi:hypothetical protein
MGRRSRRNPGRRTRDSAFVWRGEVRDGGARAKKALLLANSLPPFLQNDTRPPQPLLHPVHSSIPLLQPMADTASAAASSAGAAAAASSSSSSSSSSSAPANGKKAPADFLRGAIGRPVTVRLTTGADYRGT